MLPPTTVNTTYVDWSRTDVRFFSVLLGRASTLEHIVEKISWRRTTDRKKKELISGHLHAWKMKFIPQIQRKKNAIPYPLEQENRTS